MGQITPGERKGHVESAIGWRIFAMRSQASSVLEDGLGELGAANVGPRGSLWSESESVERTHHHHHHRHHHHRHNNSLQEQPRARVKSV